MLNDRPLVAGEEYTVILNVRPAGTLPKKVALGIKKLTLNTTDNRTARLTPTVTPEGAEGKEVFYTSTNPKVATVNELGLITAVGAGKCKIIASTANLKRASVVVTVEGAIILKPQKKTVKVGKSFTLTANVVLDDKTVTWTSSDESVATVDETGKVTAIAKGKATITATAANGDVALCVVTVNKKK